MKKIIDWLKSPKSDFVLFIALLVLANIAFHNVHLRFDITKQHSYSLSQASKRTVKTLTEPLTVNVFFSDNLPTTYTKVYQYIKDILVEYKGAANKNFNTNFFDMNKPENAKIASGYGLRQYQVQEVKNNEVGVKQVWMGIAITYGDAIEVIDGIQSENGFEYNLTTKISKVIETTDTLAGLASGQTIAVKLFASDNLKQFRINGFAQINETVQEAFNKVNKKNQNRLTYYNPVLDESEIYDTADKYGLQLFDWKNKDGSNGQGIFGLIIEYGENFRVIPLTISRSFFGYSISGIESLEENLNDSLQSLLAKSTQIGYVTGHGEAALTGENNQKMNLVELLSDMYEITELNLAEKDIPSNLTSIIVNGPKTEYTEAELYKLDQFVMRGGNLMVFADPFDMIVENQYTAPQFVPISSGIEKLMSAYGVKLEKAYVMDENCYVARQQTYQGIATFNLYWAPQLAGKQLDQKNPITKNLGYIIFLQPGKLDYSAAKENSNLKVSVLAKSSPKSWTQSQNIQLNPNMGTPYDKSIEKSEPLALLLEGKFKSAYSENPNENAASETDNLSTTTHILQAKQRGKVFVAGTSYITSNQLVDASGSEPIAMMIRNAVDYMNGRQDLCTMRTKGVSFQTISHTTGFYAAFVEYFCVAGLAVLVACAGLVFWKKRSVRRRKIHDEYNPNDSRIIK